MIPGNNYCTQHGINNCKDCIVQDAQTAPLPSEYKLTSRDQVILSMMNSLLSGQKAFIFADDATQDHYIDLAFNFGNKLYEKLKTNKG